MKNIRKRYFYWIYARDPESGKPYLVYGADNEEQARIRGLEMLPGIDFQLKRLPTSNISMASSMIHGHRLESTHSLKKASKRIGLQKTVDNLRKRQRQQSEDWL